MKPYSNRKYKISFTKKQDNDRQDFYIINYDIDFDELMKDDGYEPSYYLLGKLDDVLDLKVGESMYIEPDFGNYIGKGIVLRTN